MYNQIPPSSKLLIFLLWYQLYEVSSFFVTGPSRICHRHITQIITAISHKSYDGYIQHRAQGLLKLRASTNPDNENNPSTSNNAGNKWNNLSIEYCTGCRWMLRSAWLTQELLTTFKNELGSVTLIPSKPPSPGGTFLIKLNGDVVWDRRVEGSFPESKQLKQRVRDLVAPKKDLGHSDVKSSSSTATSASVGDIDDCQECREAENESLQKNTNISSNDTNSDVPEPNSIVQSLNVINIGYCSCCEWMMKAAYFAQELLSTFQDELYSVTLTPSVPQEEQGQFVSLPAFLMHIQ